MDFLTTLEDNSILLVPNNIKNKILDYIENNKLLLNIKLMSFNDLKTGLLFDYTNETINYVMKNYKINYTTAKEFINDIYYLTEDNYDNEKLNKLLNIKKDIENNNLLIKDPLFINLLKSKSKLYLYGFTRINKFNNYLLDLAKEYINVEIINIDTNTYKHDVIHFKTIEQEIVYVAESISKLISNNVPIDKIFIANYSNEYYFTMKKIFNLYNIPLYIKKETVLSDTPIGNYFINNLSNDISNLLDTIKKKYDIKNNKHNEAVYKVLFNLVNTYYWTNDYLAIKELINEEMKNLSIPTLHYEKEILTTNIIDNIFYDDEYIFLIGFNQGLIPKIYKDEDFIADKYKTDLMETSIELNNNTKEDYLKNISNIKNLTITYKDVSLEAVYLPSLLINDNNLNKVEGNELISNYSNNYNKLLYAKKIDNLIKFNDHDEQTNILSILNNNYNISYDTYDNNYTQLDSNKVREFLKSKNKKFSYSNISKYYECPFKFYLDNFYYLNDYKNTIDTFIGSAFHKVLEDCIGKDLNIDEVYDKFIEDNKDSIILDDKAKFFINNVKEELHFIVNIINNQYKLMGEEKTLENHELPIVKTTTELNLNTTIETTIKGIVDKCIFVNNDVIIIDYKTGTSAKINRELFDYGVNIQLPIYLYLLKTINKDTVVVGMYLQHILTGLIQKKKIGKKTVLEYKSNELKLDGLTLDNKEKIREFDTSYDNSELISSLKITKNTGEWTYKNRLITEDDEDKLYDTIKTLIENCINNVADAKFEINSINIKDNVDGCEHCKYQDICFKRPNNIKNINLKVKDTGGETDE